MQTNAKTKHFFSFFSFYDYIGLEQYLSGMAAKGWLLKKISAVSPFWKFQQAEPLMLTYEVFYNNWETQTTEQRERTQEALTAGEWKEACKWGSRTIYCTGLKNPPAIEPNTLQKLQDIHRSSGRWI